ncbi:MAG: hypothetical protein ACI4DK_03590 [Lachnospiraceae bacterium]
MKRFLKRSFVFIITFVLIFSMNVPCFASDTEHGGGGGYYVGLSDDEKLEWWKFRYTYYLARLVGLEEDAANNFAVDTLLPYWDVKGYTTLEEYFVAHVNYNDETDTFDPDEEMVADINICLEQYNDSVTMVYRYPLNKANIDASGFPNKIFLDTFISIMLAFPDCYFYVESDYRGNYDAYDRLSGTTSATVWPNHYIINVVKSPFAGVNAYPDLVTTPVTLYDENWEVCKVAKFALCSSDNYATSDNITYFSIDNIYYYNAYRRYDGTLYSSFDDFVNSELSFVFSAVDVSMCNKFSWNRTLTDFKTPYTVSDDPINVYKTVADMKKDIGSQVIGGYSPDYTGTCATSVSVDVINNIDIPDSGGGSDSGSGSDDNGGGSGGGIFDDIISGIAGGVGSIIKGIFSIIKELVDAIADAIGSIVGSITDLMSLLNGNFTDFLSAVFPFLPSEFVTILVASVTLCMLGIIIKIFKG